MTYSYPCEKKVYLRYLDISEPAIGNNYEKTHKSIFSCNVSVKFPAVKIPLGNFLRGQNPHFPGKERLLNPGPWGKNSRVKKLCPPLPSRAEQD